MKTTTEMQLVPITKLVPYVNNARTHSPEQITKLRSSLREFGFINPVIIDRDWATFLSSASQVSDARLAEREASLQFDDPVNIQYTSGTTGYPKGATLSHHNILNNGFFIGERLKYTEKDIVCLPVPFYHCFGMVLGNMAIVTHGACIVIPGEFFDPEQVLQTV